MASEPRGKPRPAPFDTLIGPRSITRGFVELALEVRACLELDQVRADLYLDKIKVYSGCADLEVIDKVGRATIKSPTLYNGVWALKDPELVFEHFFVSNTGHCKLMARLFKLETVVTEMMPIDGDDDGSRLFKLEIAPRQYVKKRKWNYEVVFRW